MVGAGLTSQTIVQAYILGDSFSNAFYPTSNMLMLITGTIGISFRTWYRFTGKLKINMFFRAVRCLGA